MSTLLASTGATHCDFYKRERRTQLLPVRHTAAFLRTARDMAVVMPTFATWTYVHQKMDKDVSNAFPVGSQTDIACEGL